MANENQGSELIIGVVCSVGTDYSLIEKPMEDFLKRYEYSLSIVSLSNVIEDVLPEGLDKNCEYNRIDTFMNNGNRIREATKRNDILALCAATKLNLNRAGEEIKIPYNKRVHLLRSLKHPDEIHALRQIYGPGFYLIALYSTEAERLNYLQKRKHMSEEQAWKLIRRDADESLSHGQQTRKVFSLADIFLRLNPDKLDETSEELKRILDIIFGNHQLTPEFDEQMMYYAFAASLRSGSLARQVGAAIVSDKNELIAVGTNDAPRPGGGLYWPGKGDNRDLTKGMVDSNDEFKKKIAEDTIQRLEIKPEHFQECYLRLKKGLLFNITEYGKDVHAEMDALLTCSRNGVSPRKGTLYTTTFPCHNCARHIIAAGIERVVYIEPYPKSRALELHQDEIALEEVKSDSDTRVLFEPFIGIGPRKFPDLFSLGWSSGYPIIRKRDGVVLKWNEKDARPRIPLIPRSYLDWEWLAVTDTAQLLRQAGLMEREKKE